MTHKDREDDAESTTKVPRQRGAILATALIILGLVQSLQLKHFKLEWTSVALILVGVALLLLPVRDLASLIESLEFGKTKIIFRKTQDLEKSVDRALSEAAKDIGLEVEVHQSDNQKEPSGSLLELKCSEATTSKEKLVVSHADKPNAENSDEVVLDLMSLDKEAALLKLSTILEIALSMVAKRHGLVVPKTGILWNKTVTDLLIREAITTDVANALLKFRNVRNSIIHSSGDAFRGDAVIASTIDSGLKLLKLLTAQSGA